MPLRDRVTYIKACMMYKSLNGIAPVYMSEMFKYVHESHSRDTRTSARSNLSQPSGKHKDIYINSFATVVLKCGMIYQQTSETLCLSKVSKVLT